MNNDVMTTQSGAGMRLWVCSVQEITVWAVSLQVQHDQAGGTGAPL